MQQTFPIFNELWVQCNENQNQIELLADEKQYEEHDKYVNVLDKYVAIARKILKVSNYSPINSSRRSSVKLKVSRDLNER